MKNNIKILVIDDEIQIRRFLKMSLTAYKYEVIEAASANDALMILPGLKANLIILDLGLPDMDGLEFLIKLREWCTVPVIILTVKDSDDDKIALLDAGADDYLTKPFSTGELLARIRVLLRRSKNTPEEAVFKTGSLVIDYSKRLVTLSGMEIKLTPIEYSFLILLSKNAGKVITQTQIMKEIWGPNLLDETQYLRIYVLQLRRKIETDPSNPKIIITEPGVGYRLIG